MRKLTEQEIIRIETRLKSLHIRYTEVYEEIFDHYCAALENTPAIHPTIIIAKLNEVFAWSVVKNRDNELEKNVSKRILVTQLDFLKFWNHGIKGLLLGLATFSLLVICILVIPASDLVLVVLALILCTTAAVYFIKREALRFSLSHKPVSISSAITLKRVGILNTIFVWTFVLPSVFTHGSILSNTLYVCGVVLVAILSVMYSISLLAIASNLPNKRKVQ